MTEWKRKRFWTDVGTDADEAGYVVLLDRKPLRTPAGQPLAVPTAGFADRIAAEWQAAEDEIDPRRMPFTRSANSAVDTVGPNRDHIVGTLSAYGGSDLVCYRAESPVELVRRQQMAWDPLLDWSARTLSAPLEPVEGVMPRPQPPSSLDRLTAEVDALCTFRLTALHDLVTLSGSLIIGLSVVHGVRSPHEAWTVSRIDEDYQAELWGDDEEALKVARERWIAFEHSAGLLSLC